MRMDDEGSISYEAAQDVIRALAEAGLCTNCGHEWDEHGTAANGGPLCPNDTGMI